ncbi:parathyroid hormone-related protein-like [Heterodontus francisci]|uniref:parathyroid hormone-related protein-like n=1 Tax=Heterodontus francisci TaxID=7792 RepID=UPI00355AFAB9
MANTRRLFDQLSFAIFLLCCSMPTYGKPVDEISIIQKRSVSEHQFMHDKSRSIQELQRRIWLHNVMGELHTAEGRGMAHSQPSRNPKHPATWPDSGDLAVLLIKLAANSSNNEGTKTPLEQLQETNKPGPFKYQNAKKNGKRKKQGKNNKRKAQRGREEKSRRHTRSAGSEVRDPGSGSDSEPLPTAAYGRLWH